MLQYLLRPGLLLLICCVVGLPQQTTPLLVKLYLVFNGRNRIQRLRWDLGLNRLQNFYECIRWLLVSLRAHAGVYLRQVNGH